MSFFFGIGLLLASTESSGQYQFFLNEYGITDQKTMKTRQIFVEALGQKAQFFIHFKEADRVYAEKTGRVLQEDGKAMMEYFEYVPEDDIHLFIRDDYTLANGQAQVFPRSIIRLYTYPPTGDSYLLNRDDWIPKP